MSTSMSTPVCEAAVSAVDSFAADEGHVRHDLVTRLRQQLELGLYDEDAKLDALLDRLMADLQDA